MKLLHLIRHWLQQPTTLSGLSMFVAGGIGIWTHGISQDLGGTLMAAALPLLLPDNTTAQRIGQSALLPLEGVLARHGHVLPPHTPTDSLGGIISEKQQKTAVLGGDSSTDSHLEEKGGNDAESRPF